MNYSFKQEREIFKKLTAIGADNAYDEFYQAAARGHLDCVEYLVATQSFDTSDINTALSYAAANCESVEMIELLIKNGANNFRYALKCAVNKNILKNVKHLFSLFLHQNSDDDEQYTQSLEFIRDIIDNSSESESTAYLNNSIS